MNIERNLLNKLCNQYGYKYSEMGRYIRIVSKRNDAYYILDCDYQGHPIELKHENTRGNTYMHSHGIHRNLNAVFKSICCHDNREFIRKNRTTRLMEIFKSLNNN